MTYTSASPVIVFYAHVTRLSRSLWPIWSLHSSWRSPLSISMATHSLGFFLSLWLFFPVTFTWYFSLWQENIGGMYNFLSSFLFCINPNDIADTISFCGFKYLYADASLYLHKDISVISRLQILAVWKFYLGSHSHLKIRTPQGKSDFPSKVCPSFNRLYFSKWHHQASMTKARNLESLLIIYFFLFFTCHMYFIGASHCSIPKIQLILLILSIFK